MKPQRILCVEDAPDVIQILSAILKGYSVTFAGSLQEAARCIATEKYALILLDIELPDGNGLEIFANALDRMQDALVIFLTGRLDFAAKVSAFSMGADDYIVKPFDPRELKLRIDSKLRKLSNLREEKSSLRLGRLILNVQEQRLMEVDAKGNNGSIDLTSLEFRIFHLLAQTPNKIFARQEILDRVWGDSSSVTPRTVDVHISNLRKKLAGMGVTIDAVIGSGYRIEVQPLVGSSLIPATA